MTIYFETLFGDDPQVSQPYIDDGDWIPDYDQYYDSNVTFGYRISAEVMAQRPEVLQNLLAEENKAERILLAGLMRIWKDTKMSMGSINTHLDAHHNYSSAFCS